MRHAARIFQFLLEASARREKTALLTITEITGSSARGLGAQMAVSETGAYAGSLSGGCIEAAIVGEAKRVIGNGQPEWLRFGAGSPFFDIRLPCGGSMLVQAAPLANMGVIQQAYEWLTARQPATLLLGKDGAFTARPGLEGEYPGWHGDRFLVPCVPNTRLLIAGNGAETLALVRLAVSYGAEAVVLSPNEAILAEAAMGGAQTQLLNTAPSLRADKFTAVVMLFHDHDRETELLVQALAQEPFFIGAMGSRATHARRLQILAGHGVPAAALTRITGPVGLIGATRDPETLALSTLGQIASIYQDRFSKRLQPATLAG